jgi:trimeric autotransporter adhesin
VAIRKLGRTVVVCVIQAMMMFGLTYPTQSSAQVWSYVYDEIGRLKGVISPTGTRADYEYDAAGNISAIRRPAAGTLDLTEFTPQVGPSGTSVKLLGSGFSTTLASNVVKFNGVAATVTAATATQLTVTAPVATTGPVSVTVATVTKTSTESFVYSTVPIAAPTISSLSLTCAAVGSVLTITGTNFDITPGETKVNLGATSGLITSMTSTSIVTTIGSSNGTGTVQVLTPRGIATSAAVLHIVPSGSVCTDVTTRLTLAVGGAIQNIPATAIGKQAALVLPVVADDHMTVHLSSIAVQPGGILSYVVVDASNRVVLTGDVPPGTGGSMHLPRATTTGFLTVYLRDSALIGTFSAGVRLVKAAVLTPDSASPLAISTTVLGQTYRAVFVGTPGVAYGAAMTTTTFTGSVSAQPLVTLLSQDAAMRRSATMQGWLSGGALTLNIPKISLGGWNSFVVTPPDGATSMSANLTLTRDVVAPIALNSTVTAVIDKPGKNLRYSFTGTAGQQIGLGVNVVSQSAAQPAKVTLFDRGGNIREEFVPGGQFPTVWQGDPKPLPEAGDYELLVEFSPDYQQVDVAATGTIQLSLSQDVLVTLVADAAPLNLATTLRGQTVKATFNATAGQNLGLAITDMVYQAGSSGARFRVDVFAPDGTPINNGSGTPSPGGATFDLQALPATGAYTVLLAMPDDATSSTSKMYLTNDSVGTIVIGTPLTAALDRPGRNLRYTFNGTAGQQLGLGANVISRTAMQQIVLSVISPGGSVLTQSTLAQTGSFAQLDIPILPLTGVYQVFLSFDASEVPTPAATGSVQIVLSQDAAATVLVDGAASTVTTANRGQAVRATFTGAVGQNLGLAISSLTYSAGSNLLNGISIQVLGPDGSSIVNGSYTPPGGTLDLSNLPLAGTYTVLLGFPDDVTTSSSQIFLSTDTILPISLTTPVTATLSRPGQNLRYTYSGTSGALLKLTPGILTNSGGADAIVTVFDPAGTILANILVPPGAPVDTLIPALPSTGTYTFFVSFYPASSVGPTSTGTLSLSLTPQ